VLRLQSEAAVHLHEAFLLDPHHYDVYETMVECKLKNNHVIEAIVRLLLASL
jgi:hypothetical protein